MYTKLVQDVYNWCIQNVYHISTNFCIHFVYKIKRTTPAKFCMQNVYKSLLKCGIYYVYKHFVYILYTFCIQKCVKICDTFCKTFVKMWDTFCIYFVFINSDLLKARIINIIYKFYTKLIQNVYIQIIVCRMDALFQHILTHLLCTS